MGEIRGISFQPPGGHLWPWLLLAAVLVAFAVWTYRRNPAPLSGGFRTLLWVLRGLAFTVLLILICRPMIEMGVDPRGQRWVGVLLDTSESLTLPAESAPGGDSRADQARKGLEQFLPGLKQRHTVRVYGFDRTARPLPDDVKDLVASEAAKPRGDVTGLGPAIETAVSEIGRTRAGAVVIVSDGVANEGLDPVSVARRLAVPIYVVGVGRDSIGMDQAVARLRVNRTSFLGDEVPLSVVVTNRGLAGHTVEVGVYDVTRAADPQKVANQALTLAGDGAEQEVRLKFRPATVGLHFYEVRLPEETSEFTLINNRRMFALDVREEKSRVFVIAGRLNWETTFLKRVLDADSSLSVSGIAHLGGSWRRLEHGAEGASVPTDAASLGKYALVALIDVSARDLPSATWNALAAWTRRGGGLLVMGGGDAGGIGRLEGTPIAPLLPVDPSGARGNGSDGLAAVLTAAGQRHPVTVVSESEAENAAQWKDLPPLAAAATAPPVRAGADVLVSSDGPERFPLLVAGRIGGGKALVAPANGYWKWDFRVRGYEDKTDFYDRLWTNAVRWLTSPDLANRLLVEPGKPVFERGEAVDFSARLSDREYQPLDQAEITVTITPTDSVRARSASLSPVPDTGGGGRTLSLTGGGGGFYSGETSSLPPGRYSYHAVARLNGQVLGDVSGIFAVEVMGLEFRRPAADLAFLERLASESGGRLFTGDQVKRLPEELKVQGTDSGEVVLLDIWDNPWFFVLLVGLLSAEWFLRRRRGMV